MRSVDKFPDMKLHYRKNIKDELVVVATNIPALKNALRLYRKSWGIEYLFADAKTRGINIEDTHMTDHNKLSILLTMVSLSMVWAYRCASQKMGRRGITKKTHNRREKSWFRIGLDTLRRWILFDPEEAFRAWRKHCPKRPLSNPYRTVLCNESCTVRHVKDMNPCQVFLLWLYSRAARCLLQPCGTRIKH